ncbi:MAG TPA: PA2779 family protein [Burkholderiales bacterium]|nr:PA2779 family protein [Burkholderiales bacterium]
MNSKPFLQGALAVLMGVFLAVQVPIAQANIVSTKEMATKNQADADKAKVQAFLDRADVRARLQTLGVNESMAKQRVASLDDWEAHLLAEKIDSLPAGGNLNLSNSDLIVILLAAILLVLII